MKKFVILLFLITLLPILGCQNKTVKWLIRCDYPEEVVPLENRINDYLKENNKDYRIKLYSYVYEDSYESIIEKVKINDIDIVNLGNERDNPDSYILKMINDGYCEEIESNYINSDDFRLDGKLYGYGNMKLNASVGMLYSKEFIDEINLSIDELPVEPFIDENVINYAQTHKNFINNNIVTDNLYIIDNLYYIEVNTGDCGFLYEHENIKDLMNLNKDMIGLGYTADPESFGVLKYDKGYNSAISEEFIRKRNTLEYSKFYEDDCIFIKRFYQYNHMNVNDIENIIYSNSQHKDEAKDLLEELYMNKDLCHIILYGTKNPKLSDDYTYEKWCDLTMIDSIGYCNEYLADGPFNWDETRKKEALQEYNLEYKDNLIDGFIFILDEDKLNLYNKVKDIYLTHSSFYLSSRWQEYWDKLRTQFGQEGDIILAELQSQVYNYINR